MKTKLLLMIFCRLLVSSCGTSTRPSGIYFDNGRLLSNFKTTLISLFSTSLSSSTSSLSLLKTWQRNKKTISMSTFGRSWNSFLRFSSICTAFDPGLGRERIHRDSSTIFVLYYVVIWLLHNAINKTTILNLWSLWVAKTENIFYGAE